MSLPTATHITGLVQSTLSDRDSVVWPSGSTMTSSKLVTDLVAIDDRVVSLQMALDDGHKGTIICAYAQTQTNENEIKDDFFEELNQSIP